MKINKALKAAAFLILTLLALLNFIAADTRLPSGKTETEGYLKSITQDQLTIEEYDGTVYTIKLTKPAKMLIDNRTAVYTDFKQGMEIYATVKGRSVNYIESYSNENNGYIPPGGKVRVGSVARIDRNQISVKLTTGEEEIYFTAPETVVTSAGKSVELNQMYVGDKIKLYFDKSDSNIASRIKLQGDSVLVKYIVKGKIDVSSVYDGTMVFTNVQKLVNNKWSDMESSMTLYYAWDTKFYIEGRQVRQRDLEDYKGKIAYMAVGDYFGKNQIRQMVIFRNSEMMYSDGIARVNWYSDNIELNNNRNLSINEGTIIVKNGRLLDKSVLDVTTSACVIADTKSTSRIAGVIDVYNVDVNNSNIGQFRVYSGRLNTVVDEKLMLKDFFLLDENEWLSYSGEKPLYLDKDTYVYDVSNGQEITMKELANGDYSVDENNKSSGSSYSKGLRDWYAYIYTDGDRVVGMIVQKKMDSLLAQRSTNGVIKTVTENPLMGWTMNIQDARDYNLRNAAWIEKTSSININLEKAVIIKNGKGIKPEELSAGDRIYCVRDDFYGKVVIVK